MTMVARMRRGAADAISEAGWPWLGTFVMGCGSMRMDRGHSGRTWTFSPSKSRLTY